MSPKPPARVAVIGMDALDTRLVQDLAASGELPSFASLLETAAWVPMLAPLGLTVGSVWPSIATGVTPGGHGFYSFLQLQNGTYDVRRRTPHDVGRAGVWKAISDAGLRSCIIDAPLMPPVPDLRGVQVVDWGTHDRMLQPSSHPEERLAQLAAEHGSHPIEGKCDDYAVRGAYAELRDRLVEGVERKWRLSASLLDAGPWDLFMTVFSESHCAGHQLWHLHDTAHPAHDPSLAAAAGGDPLLDVYRALDRALGLALAALDGATVLVVLSHGFGPHFDGDHLLARVLARIEDATYPRPAWLISRERAHRLAGRVVDRARGRARRGYSVDGSRRFFKVPNNELFGAVRVNLVGREPRGRVRPGADHEAVVAGLTDDLLALTNDGTGRPAVHRVLRCADLFEGERMPDLPDLLIDWDRSAPFTSVSSPKIGRVEGQAAGLRTGDHRPEGMLIATGPGIAPGPLATQIDAVDVAPTIAALLEVDAGRLDGRPVEAIVRSGATGTPPGA